jgi:AcrR family transcriptional regulator
MTAARPSLAIAARKRVRRSHAERSQATQQDLIDATIRVIAERGLANASTFEIAKAAGVTPGALQHHFASKNDLILRAALELVRSDDRHGTATVWPSPDLPLRERAQAAVESAWQTVYGRPNYVTVWSIFMACRTDDSLLAHMAAEREALRVRMAANFLRAFPELRGTSGVESFANLVFSALRGMGVQEMFHPPQALSGEQRAMLADLIVQRCAAAGTSGPGPAAKTSPGRRTPIRRGRTSSSSPT